MVDYIRIFWDKKREIEGLCQNSKSILIPHKDGEICYDDTGENSQNLHKNTRNRPIVICLPGAGDLRSQFRCTTPILFESGYRVISVDIRGMGNSSTQWKSCSILDVVDDIETLFVHLKVTMKRGVILIAHGESAAVSLVLASKKIELIRNVVLISPILKPDRRLFSVKERLKQNIWKPWCFNSWIKYHESLYGPDLSLRPLDSEKHMEITKNQMKNPSRYLLCMKYISAPQEIAIGKLSKIRCPIYIAKAGVKTAMNTDLQFNSTMEKLYNFVPFQESKVYKKSGHFIHVEASYELGHDISDWITKNHTPMWKINVEKQRPNRDIDQFRPKRNVKKTKKKRSNIRFIGNLAV